MRRFGVQTEVVFALAAVMAAATGVLAGVLVSDEDARLRDLLARALAAEARSEIGPLGPPVVEQALWWQVDDGGVVRVRRGGEPIDAETRTLAEEARRKRGTLLRVGWPWDEIRFATPVPGQGIAVAMLPVAASFRLRGAPRLLALGVMGLDVLVFTAFGVYLLRRRVLLPLQALREATRAIEAGGLDVRVPTDGAREIAELATATNHMAEALGTRTGALEKAVADLRSANQALRETREGLARSERLAAVGRLAAGVAHEVGNPMGALLAFLDLARRRTGDDADLDGFLAKAGREGERVRNILRRLLDFSRPARGSREPVDLAGVAREAAELIRAQGRYRGVDIDTRALPGVEPAMADRGAVMQIVLNLVSNAADAAAGVDQPRVALRVGPGTRRRRSGDAEDGAGVARGRADAVECVVADNGPGVPDEDQQRIFDAFYTTKDPGSGTGLGLSIAARLAEEQGGSLELGPAPPGKGAVFVLRLPTAAADTQERGASAPPAEGASPEVDCGVRTRVRIERDEGAPPRKRESEENQ